MARIVRPGGWLVVTTPNQLSLESKVNLLVRNQFDGFQPGQGFYPARIAALVEVDLRRIAAECGLVDVEVRYVSSDGAPQARWLADRAVMLARRPAA
jgi:hypothetical protein